MSVTGLTGAATTDTAALAALQAQARRLDQVAARLANAAASFPADGADDWRGAARTAFDIALARLRLLVGAASAAVEEALAETRRAITTMGGRQ